jgi:hypothetical protein
MKPGIEHHLMAIATVLGEKVIPAIPEESYAVGDAGIAAMLTVMMAQEVDRAADRLIRDNAAMRALFGRAATLMSGDLSARLPAAAASHDADYRISTLEAGNAALKTVLIDLHTAVEAHDSAEAEALDRDIWVMMHGWANERLLVLPPA